MSNTKLLDNIVHKDLRVIAGHSVEFGDGVNQVLVFPTEFVDAQREYPILFRWDSAENEYQAIALLGLDPGENLFLNEQGWDARYVPAVLDRGPFLIGFQHRHVDGELVKEPMIHVDMDNPRVSETEGEPVFLPHGGNSPYLEKISGILRRIHEGAKIRKAMFAAFEEHGLIEPVKVEVKLSDAEQYTLEDFFTISGEKLASLNGVALESLNKTGFLKMAFEVVTSLDNVASLIERKNRKRMTEVSV
ncbi:SapC family protein [Microbulbifer sp.]|uniref:SapC family protein n=1 Tax=Microbulbifer sp. TaxID=1908541 RepID=UPI003F2EF4A9